MVRQAGLDVRAAGQQAERLAASEQPPSLASGAAVTCAGPTTKLELIPAYSRSTRWATPAKNACSGFGPANTRTGDAVAAPPFASVTRAVCGPQYCPSTTTLRGGAGDAERGRAGAHGMVSGGAGGARARECRPWRTRRGSLPPSTPRRCMGTAEKRTHGAGGWSRATEFGRASTPCRCVHSPALRNPTGTQSRGSGIPVATRHI